MKIKLKEKYFQKNVLMISRVPKNNINLKKDADNSSKV